MASARLTGGISYRAGSLIEQRTFAGTLRLVRVAFRTVFDKTPGFYAQFDDNGTSRFVWGYDRQIVEVIEL